MKGDRKEPLYRRVNTRTHGVHHGGGEARWDRNSKEATRDERLRGSMHAGKRHGLDYTPLFRFLLSKVGQDWGAIHAEAVARLDQTDPIWWMVAQNPHEERPFFLTGESTYWSKLRVDADNRLVKVDPDLTVERMEPSCACCTHTFNGVRFVRPYRPEAPDGGGQTGGP